MTNFFDIEITYCDESVEKICYVTKQYIDGGSLHLYRDRQFTATREHLGSWPLTSIRKWKKHENY